MLLSFSLRLFLTLVIGIQFIKINSFYRVILVCSTVRVIIFNFRDCHFACFLLKLHFENVKYFYVGSVYLVPVFYIFYIEKFFSIRKGIRKTLQPYITLHRKFILLKLSRDYHPDNHQSI